MPQLKLAILSAIVALGICAEADAATIYDGSDLNAAVARAQAVIDKHGVCKVAVSGDDRNVFVPLKTAGEWRAFRHNSPVQVAVETCCRPAEASGTLCASADNPATVSPDGYGTPSSGQAQTRACVDSVSNTTCTANGRSYSCSKRIEWTETLEFLCDGGNGPDADGTWRQVLSATEKKVTWQTPPPPPPPPPATARWVYTAWAHTQRMFIHEGPPCSPFLNVKGRACSSLGSKCYGDGDVRRGYTLFTCR